MNKNHQTTLNVNYIVISFFLSVISKKIKKNSDNLFRRNNHFSKPPKRTLIENFQTEKQSNKQTKRFFRI